MFSTTSTEAVLVAKDHPAAAGARTRSHCGSMHISLNIAIERIIVDMVSTRHGHAVKDFLPQANRRRSKERPPYRKVTSAGIPGLSSKSGLSSVILTANTILTRSSLVSTWLGVNSAREAM
jgi:hypothetical protein